MTETITLKVAMSSRQNESGLGRARIDSESRRKLGVETGDVIEIIGKRNVVVKVYPQQIDEEGSGIIGIDGLTRTNAGISIDDNVTVRKLTPPFAKSITLAPNIPEGKKIRFGADVQEIFRSGLMGRPLTIGTDIIVPNVALMGNRSTFNVVTTEPKGHVIVSKDTHITVKDSCHTQAALSSFGKQITYDDVGGLDDELKRIREMIELPLKHPELFERLGIGAPKGVLLFGPPGTGKTLIAEAVANESGAKLYSIRGPEIIGQYYGQSEGRLREIFKEASETSPSIIFLDEIDSIAPNRDDVSGEVERRVVAQLLTLMDGLGDRGNVIVVAATNREDSIDPALRRPGRFDREIEIGIPGRKARADILSVHTRGMPLTDDVSIDALAGMTQGFVGADLAALCREAAMKCVRGHMKDLDLDQSIPQDVLEGMKVTMNDFKDALADVEPSGMREVLVEIPKVSWEDVGGLDDVRAQIEEAFVSEEGNSSFSRLGIEPAKGVLLYGPPGTGKTLIAKAIANEAGANFISVNGPEVASKWLGESEKAIRQIFKRAKQMAPCIIFFDELDSIAPARSANEGAWERVVAQMLTSMDGIESLNNVMIMAATNRPDIIDPALLRPGRFDKLVLVGKPDEKARLSILKVHTRKMPLAENVDLGYIASKTDGYVGADLNALCREAGLTAYRENRDAQSVNMDHFLEALKKVLPSVDNNMFEGYEKISKEIKKRRTNWDKAPLYG